MESGLSKGDRVILAFNFGLRFFVVFLGCLRAGVVAVPVYPPNPANLKRSLGKLRLVAQSCDAKMILVDPPVNRLRLASRLNVLSSSNPWPDLPYRCPRVREGARDSCDHLPGGLGATPGPRDGKTFQEPSLSPDDLAFLQFTSGSTSDPKGVMLTFGNVGHNLDFIVRSTLEVRAREEPRAPPSRAGSGRPHFRSHRRSRRRLSPPPAPT